MRKVTVMLLLPVPAMAAEQWDVFETSFTSTREHDNPFMDVQADVVFSKEGAQWKQPAFWNGANVWTVRFAFPETGTFTYRVEKNPLFDSLHHHKRSF